MKKEYFTKEGKRIRNFYRRNGHIFYILEDGTLDTSEDLNKKNENVGYHYGDLGKARDTNYFAMSSSYRSTGHFGTGTYFVSKEEDPGYSRRDRPVHKVNFNKYKLYKPKTDYEAYQLHETLKKINNQEFSEDILTTSRSLFKKDNIDIGSALHKTMKQNEKLKSMNFNDQIKQDSLSTIFMKNLGYEGIDVRHLERYDTMDYGSVIYDLKDKK